MTTSDHNSSDALAASRAEAPQPSTISSVDTSAPHIDSFVKTIARLRGPDGCPWDREQTHETLARYLLEETYEVLEAIQSGDAAKLKEELGDLLLQIVLNAQIAKDHGDFDFEDVAASINKKMIKRHPHVFADASVENAKDVVKQWNELKDEERAGENKSAMDGITPTLPALLQALKVSEKAVSQGFEWRHEGEVWDKLHSELDELKEAIANPDMQHPDKKGAARKETELELGDVLFTMVNIGRWHAISAEESLIRAIHKFKVRFQKMEELSHSPLKSLSFDELDALWNRAKEESKDQV
jgi:tetrapyrrole methylase family protein/MazG family protein